MSAVFKAVLIVKCKAVFPAAGGFPWVAWLWRSGICPHVLRYYSGGNLFAGLFGNSQMVSVAMSQLGNEGGQKFWSWYGFSSREEWCACFVLVYGPVRVDCQWNGTEVFVMFRRNELVSERREMAGK